jgi:hypothetical protein
MRNEYQNPASNPELLTAPIPDDGIPVLRDIVRPGEGSDIPILDPSHAVTIPADVSAGDTLSAERLAEITDTLQLTLNRELDYAIDGAVYERLQTAMEEVAASVKRQIHAQLEQKLPELIEQTLGKEN